MATDINKLYIEFIKQNKWLYLIYVLLLLSYPVEKIYVPHLYGKIITKLEKSTEMGIFVPLIVAWIGIQIVRIGLTKLDGILIPKFQSYVRQNVIDKFINSLETDYKEINHGDFLTKLIKIPDALQELFDQYKDMVFISLILLISLLVYFYTEDTTLGIIMTVSFGLYFLTIYMYNKSCKGITYKKELLRDNLYEHIQDVLNNSMAMFAYQQKDYENKELEKLQTKYTYMQTISYNCSLKWKIVFAVLIVLIFVVVNLYIFDRYKKGAMTASVVISIFIMIYTLMDRLMHGHYEAWNYIDAKGTIQDVFTYLDTLNDDKNKGGKPMKNGDIVFNKVNFKYSSAPKNIFNNFDLTIKQGDKIAIIGHIGSGKSTLIKLLMRYNEHQTGDISIGGQSVKDTDVISLRSGVSYVPQNTVLFDRTLYDNIVYGSDPNKITPEYILKIFDTLGMADLKQKFKERMLKPVGKNGGELSGGQRQIVWLLRAFLSNKQIIVIDEPTSSLDPESKQHIISMIDKLFVNRTVIIVTHDEDFIKSIKNTVELKEGKIVKRTK